jgi:hypothetical protein
MPHSARQCGPLRTLTSHSQPNMGFVCFRLTLNCKRQSNRILVSSLRCKDQTSNRRSKNPLKSEFAAKICFYPRRAVHGGACGALSRLTEIGKAAKICFHERRGYGSSDSGGHSRQQQGTPRMTDPNQVAVIVGEPNWAPLERAVPATQLENFMYMGRAG